jgi:OAA-family lectin sugar binding domain
MVRRASEGHDMALYNVLNQWGGENAAWHAAGIFNIGNRSGQLPVAMAAKSGDGGRNFCGIITYGGEPPIGFRARLDTMNTYFVEDRSAGPATEWHDAGLFLLGSRAGQNVVALDFTSADAGETLLGSITYAGEGSIGFKARAASGLAYNGQNQWGGPKAPWHQGGQWAIGSRPGQDVVKIDVESGDGGRTLIGTVTYDSESPVGFKARLTDCANTYAAEQQAGGPNAPWAPGGLWVIGCRGSAQSVVALCAARIRGSDLAGTMSYAGEGLIGVTLARS